MAVLSFKVQADYEKVVRLREEIAKLENQLKSFGRNTPLDEIKAVETRLAEAKSQFTALSTEAAKAGATIDSDFKAKIYSASQTVNDFTREIIDQKAVIRGDIDALNSGVSFSLDRYIPFITEDTTVFDYLSEDTLVFTSEAVAVKERIKNITYQRNEDIKTFLEEGFLSSKTANLFAVFVIPNLKIA